MKNLKKQNKTIIYSFIVLNIVVGYIFLFIEDLSLDNINNFIGNVSSEKGIFALAIPFVTLILTNILSSNLKAIIIFTRINNPLPGSRAFSKYIFKDSRITIENLENKYGPFPKEPVEQNALWYRIFKKHQDETIIVEAHKNFLLTRDIASISIMLILFFFLFWCIFQPDFTKAFHYLIYLILQALLFIICARVLGVRFTCNVLAEESIN